MLQWDGGDVELVDVDDKGLVKVCLKSLRRLRYGHRYPQQGIERSLKQQVPAVTEVVAVR